MDGNQRYSWTEKKRSPLVSRTLPRLFRCSTISCCRSIAISASSRALDLNGETKMARTNQRSPITRSAYAIRSPPQRDEVFGTHSLDHVIVFGERHLRHVLRSYTRYYNGVRTHLSLGKDSPLPRDVQAVGTILPLPVVQGLHHHYVRI